MGRLVLKQSISLDSNLFIAAYNKTHEFYALSKALLNKIEASKINVFISILVFEEFLVKIYQAGLEKDLAGYESFLTQGESFIVIDVDRKVARKAAQVRAQYPKIKTPDAIHIACALIVDAKMFITTDKEMPKKIDKLKIVNLKQLFKSF